MAQPSESLLFPAITCGTRGALRTEFDNAGKTRLNWGMELEPKSTVHALPAWDRLRLIRDEIVHEDNLMSNRLNWFTASQSFLLTALAIAHKGDVAIPTRGNDYLFPLVPIVAISSCVLILSGILAGLAALLGWRKQLKALERECDQVPNLGGDILIVVFGWSAPVLLPLVFLVAWIYLLIRGFAA